MENEERWPCATYGCGEQAKVACHIDASFPADVWMLPDEVRNQSIAHLLDVLKATLEKQHISNRIDGVHIRVHFGVCRGHSAPVVEDPKDVQ